MPYIFAASYCNGGIYTFSESTQIMKGWSKYQRQNNPIPPYYFPQSLSVEDATQELPDIFEYSSGFPIFSERARVFVQDRAPGQIEFIPVTITADPDIARQLRLPGTYYFINVLGRAQRFQWLEMPVSNWRTCEDGIERCGAMPRDNQCKIRPILPGEPLIWHENRWQSGNKEYWYADDLIENSLWKAIDAAFPGQLETRILAS